MKLIKKVTDAHRTVLAYGEVTGHAHAIYEPKNVELLYNPDVSETQMVLKVSAATEIKHEEHGTIPLPVGNYEVKLQNQYQLGELTRAAD